MPKRKWLRIVVGILIVLVIAAVAIIIYLTTNAPETSSVAVQTCITANAGDCIVYPTVSGDNLLDDTVTLPTDLAGDVNLVVVSFDQDQEKRVLDWLPLAERLSDEYAGFAFYNTPTMKSLDPLLRGIITGGMNLLITEQHLREITIMLFLDDLDLFLTTLDITDTESIHAFLLNAEGEVIWRGVGDYDDALGAELEAAVIQAQ